MAKKKSTDKRVVQRGKRVVQTWVTEAQYRELTQEAEREGISLANFVRRLIFGVEKTRLDKLEERVTAIEKSQRHRVYVDSLAEDAAGGMPSD